MNLRSLYWASGCVMGIGALTAVVVTTASKTGRWSDGILWVLYMLTATVLTVIIGFVFAVPRTRAGFVPSDTERYESNDNLVQISDWLTKLLVGAGLVQLTNIPGALANLGDFLALGISMTNGPAFAVSAALYGIAVGFATGYLWTRLRFRPLLERSDREARDISTMEEVAGDLRKASSTADESPLAATGAAATAVSLVASSSAERLPILWVDDHPENNVNIVNALNRLAIDVETVVSTAEAIERLRRGSYALVISDLGRVEDGVENRMAGRDLLLAMTDLPVATPVIIYAGARGVANRQELTDLGARLVSQRPSEVFEEAVRYVTGERPRS